MDVEGDSAGDITWVFSAEVLEHKTPSREDGISWATERKYRREGARFIIDASNALKLYPQLFVCLIHTEGIPLLFVFLNLPF